MTTRAIPTPSTTPVEEAGPEPDSRDPIGWAHQYVAGTAFTDGHDHQVGLELEFHLVEFARPHRSPEWPAVQALVAGLPAMPAKSSITLEPGGQIELSTPPQPDVLASVAALRRDGEALRTSLAAAGYGAAPLGADPARPVRRTNPHQRYVAMEQHFDALGYPTSGRAMMSATAALQVNVDAGPAVGWSGRVAHIAALTPVLVAAAATSPYLGGRRSGWHSMRQQTWQGIDPARSDLFGPAATPQAWARYALQAPVMLVQHGNRLVPVTQRVLFSEWLLDPSRLGRPATREDLDYHLTTLFPPIRPRGYLEIRCVDAMPDRWWPAMAALTVTLIDDPVAADAAAELCAPVADRSKSAARDGTGDPLVQAALMGCLEVAASRCPAPLRADVESFAELVRSGCTPGSELRGRMDRHGPLRVLEEEAHA